MCKNERRAVQLFDDLRHGEGLAGASDAEQHLVLLARGDAGDEFGDGARLVSLGLVGGCELEVHKDRIRQREDKAKGRHISVCVAGEYGLSWGRTDANSLRE